ncbi:trypsin-like [Ceratina calcarata]|uniref:Trypsin-like n=1 Tax=Ceratina calcarata TaxID=156304 RepID=A0AAJ7JB46_9HYME|nr:trypsin-like [Ceratina calcarata]
MTNSDWMHNLLGVVKIEYTQLILGVVASCSMSNVIYGSVLKIYPPFPDPQIVGGTQADISEHPYQLSFQTTSHICGASIISSKWAITAGHCVGSAPSRYTLRSGNSNNNLGNAYTIKNIIRHPNYNSRTVDYDVALLEIAGEFKLGSTAAPIKLATMELAPGSLVNVTGWGDTYRSNKTTSR